MGELGLKSGPGKFHILLLLINQKCLKASLFTRVNTEVVEKESLAKISRFLNKNIHKVKALTILS